MILYLIYFKAYFLNIFPLHSLDFFLDFYPSLSLSFHYTCSLFFFPFLLSFSKNYNSPNFYKGISKLLSGVDSGEPKYLLFHLSFKVIISTTVFFLKQSTQCPLLKSRLPQWILHKSHSHHSLWMHLAIPVYVNVTTCSLNNGQFHCLTIASGFHVIFLPCLW